MTKHMPIDPCPPLTRRAVLRAGAGLGSLLAAPGLLQARMPGEIVDGRILGLEPDSPEDQTARLEQALRAVAIEDHGLRLPPGTLRIGELRTDVSVHLTGQKGSRLMLRPGARWLLAVHGASVRLEGISLAGEGGGSPDDALIEIVDAPYLKVAHCHLEHFNGTGLRILGSQGEISGCRIRDMGNAALFAQDNRRLTIRNNTVRNCANNGILVWQSEKRQDGAVIVGNDIRDIGARFGGDGPNGNGINVFRAGGVTIRGNRIRSCAFSAIRNNSGDDCRIIDNRCEDLKEVAIFVEFAWRRALVRGNRIRNAGAGISATNMDHGGRGAVIENNVVENVRPRIRSVDIHGYGIAAEADTVIRGNVVRKASYCGLSLGWGPYLDNVKAVRNRLEDCGYGIIVSVTEGAGRVEIIDNAIVRPRHSAIAGFDHVEMVIQEMLGRQPLPAHVKAAGNARIP